MKTRGGFALVLVLACVLFVTVLIVSFLVSMRVEVASSKSSADAAQARLLADTAVNLVISQIQDVTVQAGANSLAWASQPGMLRLYGANGASGFRKLYSWDNMVGAGAYDPFSAAESVPSTWAGNPGIFTDLNSPVVSGGKSVFPILDSSAATNLNVQGFGLGTVPGPSATQPAPMPVKWLYVLSDGTVHIATGSGESAVVAAATSSNPIIGRIAFWADDDTTKININTASEGKFWSTPRMDTPDERALANSQPARGEYQRYPGHPATVSLKTVFPSLTSAQLFDLAPRLSFGGSENGTKPVQDVTTRITTDHDRLYASVDELLFKVPTSATTPRSSQPGISRDALGATKFFLTAHSRAPELNLFGQPRILSWPLHVINDANYRTVNDRLLAFCSTIGGQPFYFQRKENVSPTADLDAIPRNKALLNYLDALTARNTPGTAASFRSKYTQPETRQVLTEIFDYIRCTNLVDKTTPTGPKVNGNDTYPYTFGVSSYGEYAKGSQDRGRSRSLGTAAPIQFSDWGTRGFGGRFLKIRAVHIHFVGLGQGAQGGNATTATPVLPTQLGATVGAGWTGKTPPPDTTAVQAYIYISTLNPGEGIELWSPGHWIEIEGLDKFGVKLKTTDPTFTSLQLPATGQMSIMGNMLGGGGIVGARVVGLEPRGFTFAQNEVKKLTSSPTDPLLNGDPRLHFPFFSAILPVASSPSSPTMAFRGGKITIKVYADPSWPTSAPYSTRGALIESFSLEFPDGVFPTPLPATNRLVGSGAVDTAGERWGNRENFFENSADVLRTIPLDEGDIRLLAGPETPTSFFKAQTDYSSPTLRMVPPANGSSQRSISRSGRLVKDASYSSEDFPYVPDHINGVLTVSGAPGDWDNGTSVVGDGPFLNAADPGSISPVNATTLAYYDNSNSIASTNPAFFSPNRQMPGPVMFGSLPTGVQRRFPWQTLLFRPGPANHPGLLSPSDHFLLDLFWMPIVEPYAISEPFSTAGKINLNQQLVPFTYIQRNTGLLAAMAGEEVAFAPKTNANVYKKQPGPFDSRKPLNLSDTDGTLRQFKAKFASGEIFRSATEICDIFLVPTGKSWISDATARADWYGDDFALVGDNTRERPYADIYNKVTTKSNTYTVHYRAQALRIPATLSRSEPTIYDPARGCSVAAELRGATTIERYLDPNDERFVKGNSKADPSAVSFLENPQNNINFTLESFYRFHILQASLFTP